MSDSNDASENSIQFVEFINLPFLNITGENGQIVNNSGEHIIIEETDDNDQQSKSQEIQYLLDTNQENTELNKHMIVVHDGKQFIFSNDQINEKGEIILNSENCLDNYILSENPNEETFVMQDESYAEDESIENNEVDVTQSYQVVVDKGELEERDTKDFPLILQEFDENDSGIKDPLKIKQYAILRDGQLFIQEGELQEDDLFNCTEEGNDYNATNLNNEINNGESTSLDGEDPPLSNFGVAGKNLITGQTISLDGFITKFSSKKYKPLVKNVELKSNLNFSGVFGKSENKTPKKLSCKILAIKRPGESMNTISKQIDNDLNSSSTPSTSVSSTSSSKGMKTQTIHAIIQPSGEIETDNDSNFHMDSSHTIPFENKYSEYTYSQEPMDDLVVKTLCGLMDMESFSKHLINKNLIIKNTYKRINSATDQCIYKNITYFKGTMRKTHSLNDFNGVYEHWTFDQNIMLDNSAGDQNSDDEQSNDNSNIDLNISEVDTQQIDLNKDTVSAVSETSNGDENVLINKFMVKREPTNVPPETVGVHVIIIENEHGKKKTKVVIPKLYNITRFCSICNKLYRNQQLYKRHMRTAHASNEDKTNTCDLCNKKFKDPFTLTRHRRIHNGDKNYQCNICCKAFNTSESLKRHITIHIPSLRPLQCLKCMQRFTDQSSLKTHMLLHTGLKPYQCDVCFKRFAQCGDLNFHRKIHDPSKQFTCETCGKEFNRHSNLLRHLDIHKDNGTIFKCEICGCSYNFMSSLTRHIVNHHMKEHVS